MKRYSLFILGALFFSMPVASLRAQQGHAPEESLLLFDALVGMENTALFNGKAYLEQHITRNELHKFFLSERFLEGSVTYEGQPYHDIPMKYNVYDDLLLVQLQGSAWQISFELHKEFVNSFVVAGHEFIHLKNKKGEDAEIGGFYEVLLENTYFRLFKKYRKKRKKLLDENFAYFEFERTEAEYVYEFNNTKTIIETRRDLRHDFPELRQEIRRFYRSNRSFRKENPDRFYIRLFQELTEWNSALKSTAE